ncbi:MAG: SDR family oxidoreductase [Chloroflexi bacterium]|nr:SDR family oxidoreductase [Chloroflexota bacterium]MCC6894852.1 SDR family oxidoreductase [Anaerolineae bacterium]
MAQNWTTDQIPDLSGKTALVTGSNSGLGLETARVLAVKGAHVILTSRDTARGQKALEQIQAAKPKGQVTLLPLDLASLEAVRRFAEQINRQFPKLDLLVNNAGVMHLPYRKTADGFEMQFGTNHLGHFALTGLLLPTILNTAKARVVTISSLLAAPGHINFDDLNATQNYDQNKAYSQSKLANLLFAYELDRQFKARSADAISVAAHPGYTATNLQFGGSRMTGSVWHERMMKVMNALLGQDVSMGALPTLYAAIEPSLKGGEYIGPRSLREMRGYPTIVKSNAESYDVKIAKQLWTVSEQLTSVRYEPLFHAKPVPV